MKLMQIGAKLVAAVADDTLSVLAERIVCPQQRGFVRGGQLLDNVLEFDGAMYEHSQVACTLPRLLLLDFANAFASMAHEWIISVLSWMGCPQAMINVVSGLYHDLRSTIILGGKELCEYSVTSGIGEGWPRSGTLFSLALDPLMRAFLADLSLRSARTTVFADVVAVALLYLRRQMPRILQLFALWGARRV